MKSIILSTILFFISFNSYAEKQIKNQFNNWYVITEAESNICYILSTPKNNSNNLKNKEIEEKFFLSVALFPKKAPEVSVLSGYNHQKGGEVSVIIDNKTKTSFPIIEGDRAWARDPKHDYYLIRSMKRGSDLVIKSTSDDNAGEYSIVTYSLSGFTKAYNRMTSLCRKPVVKKHRKRRTSSKKRKATPRKRPATKRSVKQIR